MKHVWEVLRQLQKQGLYAQAKKCEWHHDSVEFLGYIMSAKGLTMADDKIHSILDWPEPWKVKDVQSFLGFANFLPEIYSQLFGNYSPTNKAYTERINMGFQQGLPCGFQDT